jgi:serine/threonine-protein kinase
MMLPTLSETEQYIWGLKAGEILRKIHTLPAPNNINDEMWFDVINEQIHEYRECGVIFENDEYVIDFINKQKHLMERRKKCFRHSDYHVGNMMIENDTLYIIDFDICDYGDPWEDLSGVVLGATYSPCFATGQLRGYFGGTPTDKEFNQVAFYIACNTLSSICWAALVGQVEIDYYLDKNKSVLRWFDNFQNPVPTWYLKDWRTAE